MELLDEINAIKRNNRIEDIGQGSLKVIQAEQQSDACIAARVYCRVSNNI
jgi:hypothetical protein